MGSANQNAAVIVGTTGNVAMKLGEDCDDVSASCVHLVPTQWWVEVAWWRMGVAWLAGVAWQVVAACWLAGEVSWPRAPTH